MFCCVLHTNYLAMTAKTNTLSTKGSDDIRTSRPKEFYCAENELGNNYIDYIWSANSLLNSRLLRGVAQFTQGLVVTVSEDCQNIILIWYCFLNLRIILFHTYIRFWLVPCSTFCSGFVQEPSLVSIFLLSCVTLPTQPSKSAVLPVYNLYYFPQ